MINPEIQFLFGGHSVEQAPLIAQPIKQYVENFLSQSTTGTVFVYFEHGDSPQSLSDSITQMVHEGIKPSSAYLLPYYFNSHRSRFPANSEDLNNYAASFYGSESHSFEKESLEAVDELVARYNQVGCAPRVVFKVEDIPDKEYAQYKEEGYIRDQYNMAYYDALKRGYLESGKYFFQKAVVSLAKTSVRRENRMVEQLSALASDPNTAGIVVPFGEAHTRMHHSLQSKGVNSKLAFFERKDNPYWFMPMSGIVGKIAMKGEQAVTELEWYRAMISQNIYYALMNRYSSDEILEHHQESILKSIQAVKKIQTIEDIAAIEERMRDSGFFDITALNFLRES